MTSFTRSGMAVWLAVLGTVPPGAAAAQDRAAPPKAVGDVTACRKIAATAERLACFDAAAARLESAVGERQITVLDREGVRQTRRSLFGFTLPSIGLFGKGRNDVEEVKEIDGVIARVLPRPDGRYEIVLADGARWMTTEPMRWAPEAGAKVHIRTASLGSYWISADRTRTVRGRRIG